jgi:hypothetical protein
MTTGRHTGPKSAGSYCRPDRGKSRKLYNYAPVMLSSWRRCYPKRMQGCHIGLRGRQTSKLYRLTYISVEITAPFSLISAPVAFCVQSRQAALIKKVIHWGAIHASTMHAKSGVDGLYGLCPRCLVLTSAND